MGICWFESFAVQLCLSAGLCGCGKMRTVFRDLEMEDPEKRRELVLDMVRNADEDQMRMIAKFLGAVLGR